jgi:hypothetical protein
MEDKTYKAIRHFTWPYRVGNIIILILGGAIFIPLLIGWLAMAIVATFRALTGGLILWTILAGCSSPVRAPSNQDQNSVRKAQGLFAGQEDARRRARLPEGRSERNWTERNQ